MSTTADKWFVERFHLRSPVQEFEDYCRTAMERLAEGGGAHDGATHREAVALVLSKLRPDKNRTDSTPTLR